MRSIRPPSFCGRVTCRVTRSRDNSEVIGLKNERFVTGFFNRVPATTTWTLPVTREAHDSLRFCLARPVVPWTCRFQRKEYDDAVTNPIPDFSNATEAYRRFTLAEAMRSLVTLTLCRIPWLARHGELLLDTTRAIVGDRITDNLLKATLFGHFCAGETEMEIRQPIRDLQKAGIGSILDYAAEDDDGGAGHHNCSISGSSSISSREDASHSSIKYKTLLPTPQVRLYDYESEAKYDQHMESFLECIRSSARVNANGYVAVKVTALGNPKLLARISQAIVETQRLFHVFDLDKDGKISREELRQGYSMMCKDDHVNEGQDSPRNALDDFINSVESSTMDYITWSMMMSPHELPHIATACRMGGPLARVAPTSEELESLDVMYKRAHALAREAAQSGVRLLMDAEQVRFQPAIDRLVLDLQRTHNACSITDRPVIYNTYQCYLKDILPRLENDIERSRRFDYHFGAKVVRGAYMESERALATSSGCSSPIHDTERDTHDSYNRAVEVLLRHAAAVESGTSVEVMLATHNQESVEMAIQLMNKLQIDRRSFTVCFGQLYGMTDSLTFQLGRHGYRAYKYVPYGPVQLVMPYLIRRAHENSSIAQGAAMEWKMLTREVGRRLWEMNCWSTPFIVGAKH